MDPYTEKAHAEGRQKDGRDFPRHLSEQRRFKSFYLPYDQFMGLLKGELRVKRGEPARETHGLKHEGVIPHDGVIASISFSPQSFCAVQFYIYSSEYPPVGVDEYVASLLLPTEEADFVGRRGEVVRFREFL